MKRLVLILAIATLGGCMTYSGIATDRAGKQVNCSTQGFGIIMGAMAKSAYEDCMRQGREQEAAK